MSFLYYDNAKPSVKANFQSLRADEYFVKDPETGGYIPLTGGGGETLELPYYAKPAKIALGVSDSVFKTVVEDDGVDVINDSNDTATHLGADALTFGSAEGNVSLEKPDVEVLKNLQTGSVAVPGSGSKVLIYDAASEKHSNTPWRDYLAPTMLQMPNTENALMQLTSGNLSFRNSTTAPGTGAVFNNTDFVIGSRSGTSFTIDTTQPRCVVNRSYISMIRNNDMYSMLDPTFLRFKASSTSVCTLTVPMLKDLERFYAKTQAAVTGDDRLVTYNPTTKDYKLIEASSGGELPSYIKPTEIIMTDPSPFRMNLKSYNMTFQNVEEEETGTVGAISDTSVMFGRRVTADGGISTTQPQSYLSDTFLTIYEAGMGTYSQLSKDSLRMVSGSMDVSLTRAMIQDLERFYAKTTGSETSSDRLVSYNTNSGSYKLLPTSASMAPKTYQYTIPRYSINDPINGRSYLDRLTRADPDDNNHAYSHASTSMHLPVANGHGEKCVINVGDSIVFKSDGPEPVYGGGYSVYFDTWYLLPFNSPAGSLTENSIFEGSIVSNSFAELPYNVSLDLRITNISTLGYCLAFRINALTITTGTIANPVITKVNHKSGFKGSFKITLVSLDITNNPALVIY